MNIDFDKLKQIQDVNIVNFNPVYGSVYEPEDGTIYYNNRLYRNLTG